MSCPPTLARMGAGRKQGRTQGQDLRKPASITVEVVADFPAEASVDSCGGLSAKSPVAFELSRAPEKAQITGRTQACRAEGLASPDPLRGHRSHSLVSGSRERKSAARPSSSETP